MLRRDTDARQVLCCGRLPCGGREGRRPRGCRRISSRHVRDFRNRQVPGARTPGGAFRALDQTVSRQPARLGALSLRVRPGSPGLRLAGRLRRSAACGTGGIRRRSAGLPARQDHPADDRAFVHPHIRLRLPEAVRHRRHPPGTVGALPSQPGPFACGRALVLRSFGGGGPHLRRDAVSRSATQDAPALHRLLEQEAAAHASFRPLCVHAAPGGGPAGTEVFGHGVRPLDDKAEALDPYRYHVAVENHVCPDHWTEKLADALLGFTLPFYHGCPNAADYFPPECFIPIDIRDFDAARALIREAIASGQYEKRLPAIVEGRRRVLEEHNLFALLHRVIRDRDSGPGGQGAGTRVYRQHTLWRHRPSAGPRLVLEKARARLHGFRRRARARTIRGGATACA